MDVRPLLVGHVLGVQRLAADARRADEHVEPGQRGDRGVQLCRVTDVVAVREVERVHPGAAGTQPLGRRGADPALAPGHERDAPFEAVLVRHTRFLYGFRHGY